MILEHTSYTAWCKLCDSSASPARRDTRAKAREDLQSHTNIQHPESPDAQ